MSDAAELLSIYLNDHLAGASAGTELAHRLARAHDGDLGRQLARLDDEIAEDRESLLDIMRELGVRPQRYKVAAGWLAEKAGRLKPNGYLVRRSPLSTVLELEALRAGVEGKAAGWRALRIGTDGAFALRLDQLVERAERQSATLSELHRQAAAAALGGGVLPDRGASSA